jgi:ureidoacrylate peracid hydrolase
MTPSPEDIIVKGKSGLCGFYSTNLDFLLRQRNIKNVVIGGLLTNCCVESTMRTAYEAGYQVYTLTDCTAAIGVDAHDSMYKHNAGMFSTVTNSEEVEKAFD